MQAKASYSSYLFVFPSKEALELPLARYSFDREDRAVFAKAVFTVTVTNGIGESNDLVGFRVKRREMQPKPGMFRIAGKWWRVAACAVYRLGEDGTDVLTSKYRACEQALACLSSEDLYGIVAEAAEKCPLHVGHFVDSHSEDRIDHKEVDMLLKETANFEFGGHHLELRQSHHLVECLATALNITLQESELQQIAYQQGTHLRDVARYLRATKFTLLRDPKVPFNNYMRAFYVARTEETADRDALEDELGGVNSTRLVSTNTDDYKVALEWAVAFAHRHNCDVEESELALICFSGTLGELFQALITPRRFEHEQWVTKEIKQAYVGRDFLTGAWYLLQGKPGAENVERKITIQEDDVYNPRQVQIGVPKECSYTRCLDEQDAYAKLAEFYAEQVKK